MSVDTVLPQGITPVLKRQDFDQISKLAYEHFGLDLRDGKQSLIEARLGKKLRELGLPSYRAYYEYVVRDATGSALTAMVDVLTTNHTSFFREQRHFDFLRKTIYPSAPASCPLHIWSAACSSGEEPYSIAMALLEEAPAEAAARVRIRATDISTRVLDHARRGIYKRSSLSAIAQPLLQRYMLQGQGEFAGTCRFKPEVRAMISFERLNLIGDFPTSGKYAVIFCRNVMIYFDKPTQERLVGRLVERLEEGGYLFVGHSESLNTICHPLEYISPAIYRKPARVSHAR